jgi:peptidoglycan DL-endopeptidase CwlO
LASPAMTRLRRIALATLGGAVFAVSFATGTAHAAPSASDLQQQIDAKGKQLEGVIQQWDGLNDQLTRTTAQAQQVQDQLAPLKAQLDAASTAVSDLAAQSYQTGNFGTIAALVTAGSPDDLLDKLGMLDTLTSQRQQDVDRYKAASKQLSDRQSQLTTLLNQQKAQQAALSSQKVKIQADIDALEKQRDQLAAQTGSRSTDRSSTTSGTAAPAVSAKAQVAVNTAMAQLGKPYVFGAAGPNSFDCSGLMQYAWARAGVQLTHYTYTQLNNDTTRISRSQLQPGDLVFFYGGEHVGMYIGNNKVVHAPQPGEVVKISDIDWMNGYYAAGRPR